ncbi:MAG: carboxypeptidase-like regulatory domain-containing protein, partial [bacterium]
EKAHLFASGPSSGMALTDSTGKYIISNLNPGTYTLLAYKSGYYPKTKRGIGVNAGTFTIVDFSLTKKTKMLEVQESYDELLALLTEALGEDASSFNLKAMATLILANQEELEVIEPATPTLTLESNKKTISPPDEVIISIMAEDTGNLAGMDITLNFSAIKSMVVR